MKSRFLFSFIALFLLFSLFLSSCTLNLPFGNSGGGDTPNGNNPGGGDTPTAKEIDAVIVPEDEISTCYYVVYGSSGTSMMAKFIPEMMDVYGLEPNYFLDSETPETKYEILLGMTNRALSIELAEAVNALAAEEGGLTWGFACRNGQFAVYATTATAFDGSTSLGKCLATLKRTYMLADSFIVDNGTFELQNVSQAALDVKEAETKEAEYQQNAADIASLITTIEKNMGKSANDTATAKNYKTYYGQRKTVSQNVKATPTAYPAADTHPRLGLNASRVAELNSELASGSRMLKYYQYGENNQPYRDLVNTTNQASTKSVNFGLLGEGKKDEGGNNYSASTLETIEACAFRYVLEHEEGNDRDAATVYGYRAINGLLNYLKTINVGTYSLKYRTAGEVMYIAAEVYDWCYDLLTEDMKANIINAVTSKMATQLEIGSENDITPSAQGPFSGHGAEAQLLRDWLAFSIAVYDEYPEYYNYVAGRITADYVPYRNAYYQGEIQGQGNSYGIYRFNFEIDSALFYETMQCTDTPVALYDFSIEAVALGFVYNTRPDSQLLHIGDDINERNSISSARRPQYLMNDYARTLFYATGYTKNAVLKNEAHHYLNSFSTFTNNDNFLTRTQFLIYNDPTLARKSKSTLPLSKYFDSPAGILITRNAWSTEGTMVYMKIGERYSGGHEHADAGSFQIYYHGMLAIDAGFYDVFGSAVHRHNKATLAHNALLIGGNGQDNASGAPDTFETTPKNGVVIGEDVISDENGKPLYAFLAGDLTSDYENAGAKEVGRYMLAIYNYNEDGNQTDVPLCFFVMDDVKTNLVKETAFLLQPMEEPTVDGNVVTIINSVYVENVWGTYQADGVLVDQAFSDSGDISIEKLEGKYGTSNPQTDGRWQEDIPTLEAGWGRVEIRTAANETKLLNVMYVTDRETNEEQGLLEAKMYANDDILGASLPDLSVCAFFNKNVEKISAATVKGEGEGVLRYCICGLCAGEYSLKDEGGNTVLTATVSEAGGMMTFTAPAGIYNLSRV